MLTKRIIPCLDIQDGRTVKGVNFTRLLDAGDPVELGARYAREGADELVYLDIKATQEDRKTLLTLVRNVALHINIPFTVGGGVSSTADAAALLEAGADKVTINSSALRRPALIDELARAFGSQMVVLAVDAKRTGDEWSVFSHGGTTPAGRSLFYWASEGQERGAGEIIFTSIDHDGTRNGFAVDTLRELGDTLTVPLIASGGAGANDHFVAVFRDGHVDGALAAGTFHFGTLTLPSLKNHLSQNGIPIRKTIEP